MGFEWWHWIVLGIALVIAELAVPAFFVIWFGLGALLVGLALALVPALGMTAQLALWILASLAMVILWFRVSNGTTTRPASGSRMGIRSVKWE
jgi:membrane protein implicated in regulation of membrane protease activity